MPGLLDWWYRIRRVVGPPGAPATRAPVPSDVEAAQRAELTIVLQHVDALEPELQAIEQRVARDADRLRADVAEQIERIELEGRARAAVVRAEAADGLRDHHEREAKAATEHAAAQAEDVRRIAQASFAELVDSAVAMVRDFALDGGKRGSPQSGGS